MKINQTKYRCNGIAPNRSAKVDVIRIHIIYVDAIIAENGINFRSFPFIWETPRHQQFISDSTILKPTQKKNDDAAHIYISIFMFGPVNLDARWAKHHTS